MVKKEKEMNPKQKVDQGKCASPNATTISFFVNKQNCVQLVKLLPQFMKSQTV